MPIKSLRLQMSKGRVLMNFRSLQEFHMKRITAFLAIAFSGTAATVLGVVIAPIASEVWAPRPIARGLQRDTSFEVTVTNPRSKLIYIDRLILEVPPISDSSLGTYQEIDTRYVLGGMGSPGEILGKYTVEAHQGFTSIIIEDINQIIPGNDSSRFLIKALSEEIRLSDVISGIATTLEGTSIQIKIERSTGQ